MPNPRRLDNPEFVALPVTSRYYRGKGNGYANTQYVPGANTIFIDDYVDADGKLCKGLKNQGYDMNEERRKAYACDITYVANQWKYSEDVQLIEYVNTHEGNVESTAGQSRDRTVTRLFTFAPLRKEEDAKKRVSKQSPEDELTALEMVVKLRTKTSEGYIYDIDQMNALISMLEVGGGLGEGNPAQKFEIILKCAKSGGASFVKIIEDETSKVRMNIAKAAQYNIIKITSKGAEISEGDKFRKMLEYKGAPEENHRIHALSLYLLGTPAGLNDYNTIISAIEIAQLKEMK